MSVAYFLLKNVNYVDKCNINICINILFNIKMLIIKAKKFDRKMIGF